MTTDTPRKPGRPRNAVPAVEQASPAQYTIAKLTPHMLAGEIHRLHQEGEDLTPVHSVSDKLRAVVEPPKVDAETSAKNVAPEKVAELKATVEAAKIDRPRTFAVAYHNKRGALKLAHGTEYEDGDIDIHNGYGFAGAYADTLDELHETALKHHGNAYHVDYTD